MMEPDVDLRRYFVALLRRWHLIGGLALISAVLCTLVAFLPSRSQQASATVLILPATSELSLDPRFITRDATFLTSPTFQRQALISLATSSTLEHQVAEQFPSNEAYESGDLLKRINVAVEGDLMKITAAGESETEALALAETWAKTYERLIAEVYSRDAAGLALLDEQIAAARERYNEAQTELEQFLGQSDIVAIEQRVKSITGLLDGSVEASIALYTQYLSRTQELDLLLSDARTLRAQFQEGSSDGLANRLAILSLRARVAGDQLPVELRVDDAAALAVDAESAVADLDKLIMALEEQRSRLVSESQGLVTGDTSQVGLDPLTRQRYEQELTELRQRVEQFNGQRRAIEQRRDISLSSLELLQRKRDEQQIAETAPLITVRFISATVTPPGSALMSIALQAALGLILGAIIGMAYTLWLEIIRPRWSVVARSPLPPEASAEQPVATR